MTCFSFSSTSFRSLVVLFFLYTVLFSGIASARTIDSNFGFTLTVPDEWFVLTKQEIEENSELFSDAVNGFGMDESVSRNVKSKIESGQIELIYLNNDETGIFANNINALKSLGRVPKEQQIKNVCKQYAVELPKLLNKPINMYACELTNVAGNVSFYTEFDGVVDNTKSAQYQFQSTENKILILTLTASNEAFSGSKTAFINVMETIRLK